MTHVPLRTSWVLVALLAVTLLFVLAPGMAWAQQICGVGAEGDPGDPGEEGFQVDGQFFSGPDADDWARGDSYDWVILDDGTPNPIFVPPGLYERDPHWAGGAADPTTFNGGSNKNNDDISPLVDPWTVTTGSGPQKNDLTDLYAHSRVFYSDGDHVWIVLGAMTRAANGDSHVDFEWNIAGFEVIEPPDRPADAYVIGLGPHAGRTANIDFIISADFTGGGNVVETHVRQWQWVVDHYEYVDVTGDLPAGSYWICADDSELGAPVPYWGAIAPNGDEVPYGGNATPLQFVEVAVDLAAFGINPWDLCTTESTIMFKTRSSQEFTAELKDFGLYPFPIVSTPRCVLNGPDPMCEDDWPGFAELCGPETPNGLDYKYVWFGPAWADSFVTTSPDSCVTISDIADTGLYQLIVRDLTSGCWSGPCDYRLIVYPEPQCEITGPMELCVLEPYQDIVYAIGCPGFEIDQYTWSVTSGNAEIVGGQGTTEVTVRVHDQSFTLQCYIADYHGDVVCDGTFVYPVTVHPNPDCEIVGDFALCLDDFGASQLYALGNCPDFIVDESSCNWTLTGANTAGAVITEVTNCVATVTIMQAGEFTLHVEYEDANGCPGVAEQTVIVYPEPDCDIDGVTEICLDDATDLEYSLMGCDDFTIVTCDWSLTANTAGATLTPTDCTASVDATQAGSFTLHVEYEDENGCDGTADLTVVIYPEPDCEIEGVTAICLDAATDLSYSLAGCDDFVIDTCVWSLTANTAGATLTATDCTASVDATQVGYFTLHVEYEDENGCDGTADLTVTIYPEPDCEIDGVTEICLDDATDLSYSLMGCDDFNIVTCDWSLTANTAGATLTENNCEAIVTASQAGQFTLHVSFVDDNGCDGTADLTVEIYPEPDCDIDGVTEVCLDDATDLTYSLINCPDYNIVTCDWSFTANTAGATLTENNCEASVDATQAGYFTLHVEYWDENGCDGAADLTVTIYPEPDCDIDGVTAICLDNAVDLSYSLVGCDDFNIVTCDWWITDNTAGATLTENNCEASVDATQAGSFTLHVAYEDENGCDGTADLTVMIYPEPDCEIDGVTAICLDEATDLWYSLINCPDFNIVACDWWITGNTAGATLAENNCEASVTASQAGQFTLHVEYWDENDCDGTADLTVTIYPEPDCDIDGVTEICLDDATGLSYSLAGCPDFNIVICDWSFTANTAGATLTENNCEASVDVTQAGYFTLYVEYEDENGCDGTADLTVTIHPEPDCTITGPDAMCYGDTGNELCAPDYPGYSYLWNTGETTRCISLDGYGVGTYVFSVTVTDENDCEETCEHPFEVYEVPGCTITGEDICFDDVPARLCGPEAPPGANWHYEWTVGVPVRAPEQKGFLEHRLNDTPYNCFDFDAPFPGAYAVSLVVTDLDTGCASDTCLYLLNVYDHPACSIEVPDPLPVCGSEDNELTADVALPSTVPDFMSYFWELAAGSGCGWEITGGQTTETITYTAGMTDQCCATFVLTATAHYGEIECAAACTVSFCCEVAPTEFCSFTQGFYGNAGGAFNGITTLDLLDALITDAWPLVVGVPGAMSLTFPEGTEQCVVDRLPAGGPPSVLSHHADFGDETISLPPDCQTDPPLELMNGKFRNVFLGQVIALALNVRVYTLDEDIVGHLGDAPLCLYMSTQAALCGPDGECGTADDVPNPDGDIFDFTIAPEVLQALDELYGEGHRTVEYLLMLANRALAGLDTAGANIGQINHAVSMINEGFDECRFLIWCREVPRPAKGPATPMPGPDGLPGGGDAKEVIPSVFALSPNAPNPVHTGTSIRYALPEASRVHLVIYNLRGQVVAVLKDDVMPAGYHTVHWHTRNQPGVSAGVYFYKMEAVGIESGRSFTRTLKMVVVR
jgi:hypothetical protein